VAEQDRPDEATRGAPVTVFVSDPSAEAEQIAQALRGAGYVVVDVPLSMLVARVAVQRPRLILIDADAEGAIESIARIHELSDEGDIDVVFVGKGGESLAGMDDALAREGSGFFARPVDVAALLKKVEALTGGPSHVEPPRHTTPPPSLPSSRAPASSSSHSLPPASMRSPEIRPIPRATPAPRGSVPLLGSSPMELAPQSIRRSTSVQAPLSGELEGLLLEAEQRVGIQIGHESMLPSPEEEIEAVLPADVLASLDEPIEDDEDDAVPDAALGAIHRGHTTGAGQARITTGADTGAGTPPNPRAASSRPNAVDPSVPPPKTSGGGTNAGSTGASTTGSVGGTQLRSAVENYPLSAPPPRVIPSPLPVIAPVVREVANDVPQGATVLGPADAPRVLAGAITEHQSGVLAFETRGVVRRVVLREGDVVTAASSLDDESLLPFLAARGELPRDRVAQLAGKVPPWGRHAGAALVAHGYMRQDQLWSVLRAHAEWVLARVVGLGEGTAGFEADPPARLRGEPSVFGAATGAEVFVEVVRRVVAPADAVVRMGGAAARVASGQNERLAAECALGAAETDWLARTRGRSVGDALSVAGDSDFASVLYALTLLGVCEAIPAIGAPAAAEAPARPSAVDPLDDEAIRARVRARMQLVDEGDYFAVLGVPRDATSYEVKRAFLELRRAFEPSRLLTPALADLVADVRKIASVLDEAYEILRDGARRERYRRAIDAAPR
jgi:hypothetical protein